MSTTKQKMAVKKTLENLGKPLSQIMREVGYSEAMAKNPKYLTNSKGWKEEMGLYLPDDDLLTIHRKLLDSKDWRAAAFALDRAYRLKGKYAAENIEPKESRTLEEFDEEDRRLAEEERRILEEMETIEEEIKKENAEYEQRLQEVIRRESELAIREEQIVEREQRVEKQSN